MVSIYDADVSIPDLSITEIQEMSTKTPATDRVTGLFKTFGGPGVNQGIFMLFSEFLYSLSIFSC